MLRIFTMTISVLFAIKLCAMQDIHMTSIEENHQLKQREISVKILEVIDKNNTYENVIDNNIPLQYDAQTSDNISINTMDRMRNDSNSFVEEQKNDKFVSNEEEASNNEEKHVLGDMQKLAINKEDLESAKDIAKDIIIDGGKAVYDKCKMLIEIVKNIFPCCKKKVTEEVAQNHIDTLEPSIEKESKIFSKEELFSDKIIK